VALVVLMPSTVTTVAARELLGRVPFFRTLAPAALDELLAASDLRLYGPKQILFAELEPGDELLVILEGRAAISVGSGEGGGEERLGEVGPGSIVGEIALLTGSLRSANVIALEQVAALALGRRRLHALMARFPELARQFMVLLSGRLGTAEDVLGRALDPSRAPAIPLEGLDPEAHRIAA
jgi:CRP/FNR family cyclic AMP-dependent transcriptional regulator